LSRAASRGQGFRTLVNDSLEQEVVLVENELKPFVSLGTARC
jgi:hypothetical protein